MERREEDLVEIDDEAFYVVPVPTPTIESLSNSYSNYLKGGGMQLISVERQLGTYVEPPTMTERLVKAGSDTLRLLGFKA